MAITPGFIDAHSHSDLQVLEDRREKVEQGVTSELVGNCGFSPYPAPPDRSTLHEFANGVFCGDDCWGWASAGEYLREAVRASQLVNVASLVGHGSLRVTQESSGAGRARLLRGRRNAGVHRNHCFAELSLGLGDVHLGRLVHLRRRPVDQLVLMPVFSLALAALGLGWFVKERSGGRMR